MFLLMLKQTALSFFEENIEKKGLVDTIIFPALVQMFKKEVSTKERENELCLDWNSFDWADMAAQYPSESKENIMVHLLERFETLRRCLATMHLTDEMQKQRLLFLLLPTWMCVL